MWKNHFNSVTKARESGYFIELHYVGVENADIARERVAARVKQGGNLKIVLPECDLAAFYDYTIEFRRFAIYKNGKAVRVSRDVPMWYAKFTGNAK